MSNREGEDSGVVLWAGTPDAGGATAQVKQRRLAVRLG